MTTSNYATAPGFIFFVLLGGAVACSSADPAQPDAKEAADASASSGDAAPTPAADAGETPSDASAPDAASAPTDAAPAEPGTCRFTVDGTTYQSAAGDIFTLATLKDGNLSVQCVAVVGPTRFTVQFTAAGVSGPGVTAPGLAQLSEQPAAGGSPTQYRSFTTPITVTTLTGDAVAGSAAFVDRKSVTASFNLALKK